MNDFESRGPVQQVVYRWDGNHGRQGTGMNAVAHSCDAERAEEIGRELGPLLWVSGAAAARPSVVRTLSRDGDVLLVQRWPTVDRGGRPSTVSHVLVGNRATLKVRQCLGLADGGWRRQEKAEQASGRLPEFDGAFLDELAYDRLPGMLDRLPQVEHALILATAELLRDPTQRVSLLLEDEAPRDWPDRDAVPVVYLGLFLLFGDWLGQEWTFATCDTLDTHPLRLMAVPRWEPDTGGSGPLARVMGRRQARPRFEHRAAAQLVKHLLAHRKARPGVPQLTEALPGGATLDWEHRRALLQQTLGTDRTPPAGTRLPDAGIGPMDAGVTAGRDAEPEPEPARTAVTSEPYPAAHTDPYPERHGSPPPPPRPLFAPPQQQPTPALHQHLRGHRRGDVMGQSVLLAELRRQPDELLLRELRSGELPAEALELLLDELGSAHRVQVRSPEVRHELCAEVLRNDLYFTPHGPGVDGRSGADRASRAARLFTWAVAPLARDERHQLQLQELLYRMSRDPHPTTGNWLRQSIIEPPNGQVPDLPPVVWSRLLANALVGNGKPTQPQTTQPTPHSTPATPQVLPRPHTSPAPMTSPPPRSFAARLTGRHGAAGCLLAGGLGFCVVVMGIVIVWFVS
ncbi:hypothetical protein [Streptomyces lanatus]|uniref:Uncharacterized protein n=1 Tax=Streptomyces lanatus TaxID=66900 RepID=A0ABV1XV19_9ACTN|nr:hypothetical protein [Streptomyces lanatus]GHH13075.1 hypothetical protein GCM10018780_52330 [Streptomyces lanatus]